VSSTESLIAKSLIERAQNGDERAFDELVRAHQRDVFKLALKLLGNYELALDASQETFIRAWRALPRFRGDSTISTWLHRITVNTSFNLSKKAQRHRTIQLGDQDERLECSGETPEEAGERIELSARLRSALSQLAPNLRDVVVMKDVQGYSHAEDAKMLSISVGAAKVRLHRARVALREMLGRD